MNIIYYTCTVPAVICHKGSLPSLLKLDEHFLGKYHLNMTSYNILLSGKNRCCSPNNLVHCRSQAYHNLQFVNVHFMCRSEISTCSRTRTILPRKKDSCSVKRKLQFQYGCTDLSIKSEFNFSFLTLIRMCSDNNNNNNKVCL